jgi:hypothetical protein
MVFSLFKSKSKVNPTIIDDQLSIDRENFYKTIKTIVDIEANIEKISLSVNTINELKTIKTIKVNRDIISNEIIINYIDIINNINYINELLSKNDKILNLKKKDLSNLNKIKNINKKIFDLINLCQSIIKDYILLKNPSLNNFFENYIYNRDILYEKYISKSKIFRNIINIFDLETILLKYRHSLLILYISYINQYNNIYKENYSVYGGKDKTKVKNKRKLKKY